MLNVQFKVGRFKYLHVLIIIFMFEVTKTIYYGLWTHGT